MATRTIRTNLMWVVLAALIPLTAVASWQAYLAVDDSRELVAARLRANAWSIAENQRAPFIIAQNSLTIIADQPDLRSIGPRCGTILKDAIRSATGTINLVRTDANGKARCSVLPFIQGQDLSENVWWKERRARSALYLSPPEMGTISGQPIMIMVYPLLSNDGKFDGAVTAGLSIEKLRRSLQRTRKDNQGQIFVTDYTGRPVVATGGTDIPKFAKVSEAQWHPHFVEAKDGTRWTFVSAPLFRNDLHVVYAEPSNLTTKAAVARMWPSLLLPLLALALTSIAIWIATQKLIVRWLDRLRQLTARFARGDFRSELDDYKAAPSELAEFATDLHNMARDINAQERELRDALAAKTALTKEVNHRVKNNLQIVNSLLTLQADRIVDVSARLALDQAKSRIAALGLIHRLLYEEDTGEEQGQVNMRRLLSGLCGQLRNSYRDRPEIELDCEAANIAISADQAVPVTLFTVEAVTNAFQHAFLDGVRGRIDVDFSYADMSAEMRVADDGRGFIQEAMVGQMGIDLINAFADQVGGTIEISSPPTGTVLILRFPVTN